MRAPRQRWRRVIRARRRDRPESLVQAEPQNARRAPCWAMRWCARGYLGWRNRIAEGPRPRRAERNAGRAVLPRLLAKGESEKVLEDCNAGFGTRQVPKAIAGDERQRCSVESRPEAKPLFEAALAAEPDDVECIARSRERRQQPSTANCAAKAVLDKASAGVKEKARYWLSVAGMEHECANDFAGAAKSFQSALDGWQGS
jgi:hypothetical protein